MVIVALFTLALSGQAVAADTLQSAVAVQPPQQQSTVPPPATDPAPEPRPQADQPSDQSVGNQKAEAKEPPTPPHTGIHALFHNFVEDVQHLPSRQNLYLTMIGAGLAAAAHPADQSVNARLVSSSSTVNAIYKPGHIFGDTPEQVVMSLGTYAYGRMVDAPKVSHLGMDLLQAQMLTEMIVEPLKFATHRERPDGSNHQSFPSGHAAITFAGATVIERHLGWRKSILGYAIASYVATSRLHDNRHYLSDVAFGAAMGSIAGRTVVHHASDYWAIAPVRTPNNGVALLVTRTSAPRSQQSTVDGQ
jgi:hypothetical protein